MGSRGLISGRKCTLSWVFSLLLLLSASGQALAFLLCRDADCPMFSSVKPTPKSCCDGETESSKQSCDCCELSELPEMNQGSAKIGIETSTLVLSMIEAPQIIEAPQGTLVNRPKSAFYHPDHSPPDPGFAPDLGRAPPAA